MTTGLITQPTTDDSNISVIDRGATVAVARMQSRMEVIMTVMANVLVEGQDYGKIPGTGDKPALYKPGAEKLLLTFNLASGTPTVEDLSGGDEIRYRCAVPVLAPDGRVLSVGIGEASTNEEKYRWKRPVCQEEYEVTPPDQRRIKFARGEGGKIYQNPQIRTSPADLANTVLKMGHKRALIHATLLVTGASSVFNQDVEDFSAEMKEHLMDVEEDGAGSERQQPQVRRKSERAAASAAATGGSKGGFLTEARRVKDVRKFGTKGSNWALSLEGDPEEYTTREQQIAMDLEVHKGTDTKIIVSYENNDFNGKTYHNIKSFVVAPEKAVAPPSPAATTPPPTAQDIPFGRG